MRGVETNAGDSVISANDSEVCVTLVVSSNSIPATSDDECTDELGGTEAD